MSRKRLLIIITVVVGVILVCACLGVGGYALWNTPLGPALSVTAEVTIPTQQEIITFPTATVPVPAPTAALSTPKPVVNCGQTGSQNILIMGVDAPGGTLTNNPLVIRIIKIDFSRKTAGVFSFPRDLWLPITGLESLGISQTRLGESYRFARSNAGLSAAAATNLVAQNLYNNFGALSDHYITAKISTLAAIIDSVGGITVDIPVAYDGTPYHLLALEYATAPSPLLQWGGGDRQTQILVALYKKVFSSEMIPRLPGLIPQFLQAVTTDLSAQQAMDLACLSQQISNQQISFGGVGSNDVTYGAGGVLYPNIDAIRAKVQQLLGKA